MRRLKIAVCLIFVASCVIFAGYTVKSKMLEDTAGDHMQG